MLLWEICRPQLERAGSLSGLASSHRALRKCLQCGSEFGVIRHVFRRGEFCSKECFDDYKRDDLGGENGKAKLALMRLMIEKMP